MYPNFARQPIQQRQKKQPAGNVYARNSVQNVVRPNVTQTNTSQEQIITVMRKHDTLLTKLLQRFNDLEKNMESKIQDIITKRLVDHSECLSDISNQLLKLGKKNEELENKLAVKIDLNNMNGDKSMDNSVNESSQNITDFVILIRKDIEKVNDNYERVKMMIEKENTKILKIDNKINNVVDTVDDIQTNMASVTFIDRNKLELNHDLKNMFNSIVEKYEKFNETKTRELTDWMNNFQYNSRTAEIVEDFEKQKDDLFYPDQEVEGKVKEEEEEDYMVGELEEEEEEEDYMKGDVSLTDMEIEEQDEQSTAVENEINNDVEIEIEEEDEQSKAMKELEKTVENKINNDIQIEVIKKKNIQLEINEKDSNLN